MARKKRSKGRVVRKKLLSNKEGKQLLKDFKELRESIDYWVGRIVFVHDVVLEAGRRLQDAGRLNPKSSAVITTQTATLAGVITKILQVPQPVLIKIRKSVVKEDFEQAVDRTMNEVAPTIILPPYGTKGRGGKFIIN